MCIIVVKGAGVPMPSKRVLSVCWQSNPDGAGYMYNGADGRVQIRKGYMSFKSLWRAVRELPVENAVVLHFRIGTSGGKEPGLTHPFPVCGNYDRMRLVSGDAGAAVAHNGIFGSGAPHVSDTMKFIRDYLSPDTIRNRLDDMAVLTLIARAARGAKMAIMTREGINLIGDFLEEGGIKYSNLGYIPYEPKRQYDKQDVASQSTLSWQGGHDDYMHVPDGGFDDDSAYSPPSAICPNCQDNAQRENGVLNFPEDARYRCLACGHLFDGHGTPVDDTGPLDDEVEEDEVEEDEVVDNNGVRWLRGIR